MAIEKSWERQGPANFTADGGADGVVSLSSVECFKVKQRVKISSATQSDLVLEIKKVISYTQLIVGPVRDKTHPGKPKHNILSRSDISAYTLADGASITAAEQPKAGPSSTGDIFKATYEQEPTVALRTIGVDKIGNPWDSTNPLPIAGTFAADIQEPTSQEIQNIPTPGVADTEFVINLPDNTQRYFIRVRDNASRGRIAFGVGETATKYWSLSRGTIFDSKKLDLPVSSKIYMTASKANMTIELITMIK